MGQRTGRREQFFEWAAEASVDQSWPSVPWYAIAFPPLLLDYLTQNVDKDKYKYKYKDIEWKIPKMHYTFEKHIYLYDM